MRAQGALEGTVLVVDDEEDVADSIRETLEVYLDGVRAVTASSGTEALAILQREHVDLILTDYRMPRMDGIRFLREARLLAPTVPRILVTAYPDLDVAIQALNEEHITNFLTKPVAAPALVEAVAACLHGRQAEVGRLRSIAKALGRWRADTSEPGEEQPA